MTFGQKGFVQISKKLLVDVFTLMPFNVYFVVVLKSFYHFIKNDKIQEKNPRNKLQKTDIYLLSLRKDLKHW